MKVNLQNEETQKNTRIQNLEAKNFQQDLQFKNLETNITAKLTSLENRLNKIETNFTGKGKKQYLSQHTHISYSPLTAMEATSLNCYLKLTAIEATTLIYISSLGKP